MSKGLGTGAGGNGEGTETGALFRDKPRKGALRAGSSINAPIRDNGGGGGAYVERVRPFPFPSRSLPFPSSTLST